MKNSSYEEFKKYGDDMQAKWDKLNESEHKELGNVVTVMWKAIESNSFLIKRNLK